MLNLLAKYKVCRYKKLGVGKFICGNLYVHKSAASELDNLDLPFSVTKLIAKSGILESEYDVIRVTLKNNDGCVTLIRSEDWDTSNEPVINGSYTVSTNNNGEVCTHYRAGRKTNLQIYHHKWLFCLPSYDGFCQQSAMQRSLEWLELGKDSLNTRLSGNSDYWDAWLKLHQLPSRY